MIHTRAVCHSDFKWLYRLLKQRDNTVNISHKKVPAYADHVRFCQSCPYDDWKVLFEGSKKIGHFYITRLGEIGTFVDKKYQRMGYGKVVLFMALQSTAGRRVLANINPLNKVSAGLFKSFGFKLIQHTYELVPN